MLISRRYPNNITLTIMVNFLGKEGALQNFFFIYLIKFKGKEALGVLVFSMFHFFYMLWNKEGWKKETC